MACLGNKWRSLCHFWGCIQILHFRLSRWLWGLLHFFYGILAHSSRCNGHLNTPIPVHFSSMFSKMSMFILAISCLTTADLPWFMDLTGMDLDSYAILFFTASDFTFITRHIHNWASFPLWPSCFILSGAVSSCPLLFPSSMLDPFRPGGTHLSVSYFFVFLYSLWGSHLTASILGWFAIPSSSESHFVRTLLYDLSIFGGPTWHGS